MKNNKLYISSAGSGKTTLLVCEALKVEFPETVLIVTYTEENEHEIRTKLVDKVGCIPANIQVQTWFTFLLRHGVRPYQGILNNDLRDRRIGFYLTEEKSGLKFRTSSGQPRYFGKADFLRFYFTRSYKIYSDKISQFVLDAEATTNGEVFSRLSRIYQHLFIDEVQDLAGYDLEIVKKLFSSSLRVLLAGDPRQVIYLTHPTSKHSAYKNGGLPQFVVDKCRAGICEIDTASLSTSHRNNEEICKFSSTLCPEFPTSTPCDCADCKDSDLSHEGIFILKKSDVESYIERYNPQVLRYMKAEFSEVTYGKSKGRTFNRVLIYPTDKIRAYLKTGSLSELETVRSKFYVAITRARKSAAIVLDYTDDEYIEGVQKFSS